MRNKETDVARKELMIMRCQGIAVIKEKSEDNKRELKCTAQLKAKELVPPAAGSTDCYKSSTVSL